MMTESEIKEMKSRMANELSSHLEPTIKSRLSELGFIFRDDDHFKSFVKDRIEIAYDATTTTFYILYMNNPIAHCKVSVNTSTT